MSRIVQKKGCGCFTNRFQKPGVITWLLLGIFLTLVFSACESVSSLGLSVPNSSSQVSREKGNGLLNPEAGDMSGPTTTLVDAATPLDIIIRDVEKRQPIATAVVFHAGQSWKSDAKGQVHIESYQKQKPIHIKASGYRLFTLEQIPNSPTEILLTPFSSTGLYLTYYGIGYKPLREGVLQLLQETGMNSLVVDIKGDRGLLSAPFNIPMAAEIGASGSPTIPNIHELLQQFHNRQIYTIARIVVFKDNLLAQGRPGWTITDTHTKKPWKDNENLAWVDPFRQEVWEYNIAIAKAAAMAGFDEIQFDYVRFPTGGQLSAAKYSRPNTRENREEAITGFLERAYQELLPYHVFLSADIFGYVPWNQNDTDIGQSLPKLAPYLDYICFMLYPSGYHLGIPGYRNPVSHPGEVVYLTLEQAKKRLGGQSEKFRPWIQNFRDYAFDKRPFTETEILAQVQACEKAGTSGWLLWDPTNRYSYTLAAFRKPSPGAHSKGGDVYPENYDKVSRHRLR